jgi:hypothetical protein
MKKFSVASLLALALSGLALADSGGKEITITGKGCCAKCCLKTADACQGAVTVEKDGAKKTYYLVDNEVAKNFHDNICKGVKDVVVTGKCEKVGDKLQVTASKIELAKK